MNNIQIDLDFIINAAKKDISVSTAILLWLIYNKEEKGYTEYIENCTVEFNIKEFLTICEMEGLVKITGENLPEDLEFRPVFTNLVTPNKLSINFDEFWDVFPSSTRSGRPLRAVNKANSQGKPTRDYEVCKKKYLSKVKNEELHKLIVSIIKKKVELNDYEYINNMETYINQCKWERDQAILSRNNGQIDFSKNV